jgi:hypothetical protein
MTGVEVARDESWIFNVKAKILWWILPPSSPLAWRSIQEPRLRLDSFHTRDQKFSCHLSIFHSLVRDGGLFEYVVSHQKNGIVIRLKRHNKATCRTGSTFNNERDA